MNGLSLSAPGSHWSSSHISLFLGLFLLAVSAELLDSAGLLRTDAPLPSSSFAEGGVCACACGVVVEVGRGGDEDDEEEDKISLIFDVSYSCLARFAADGGSEVHDHQGWWNNEVEPCWGWWCLHPSSEMAWLLAAKGGGGGGGRLSRGGGGT